MALTAAKLWPKNPEIQPLGNGLLLEVWQLTGDGADTAVDVTPDSIKRIVAASAGMSTNNVTSSQPASVTFTFGTAPGNGLTLQAFIYGRQ